MLKKSKIFISATLIFLLCVCSYIYALEKITGPEKDSIAGIALGDSPIAVTGLLGEPSKKTSPQYWAADGASHYDYIYKTGIEINFMDDKVYRISMESPCKKGTSRGIKIGDPSSKIKENYILNYEDENPIKSSDNLSGKTVYCGNIYFGIQFVFDKNARVKSISIGSFAE